MKYQKDYQNKQNTAHKSNIKPHTHTGTQHISTHIHSSTHNSTAHIRTHSTAVCNTLARPASMPYQRVARWARVRHTEVVPTFDTELTYHSYGGAHGSEPIPTVFYISKYNKKRCDCGDDRHRSNTFSTLDTNSKGSTKM